MTSSLDIDGLYADFWEVCLSVYISVLTNRLTETVAATVPSALVGAGLPSSSVADFLQALTAGTAAAFQAVPDISPDIIAVGTRAYQVDSADAYRTVYLSTIVFFALGLILTFFATNTDSPMLNSVAATLHGEAQGTPKNSDDEKAAKY
jgi:hypothetical protein